MTREEAMNHLKDILAEATETEDAVCYVTNEDAEALEIAIEALKHPERKKGKWLLFENQRQEDIDNGNYMYTCSNCLRSDIHAKTVKVQYCWFCGADMRGDEE